jgi:hypothetical protein
LNKKIYVTKIEGPFWSFSYGFLVNILWDHEHLGICIN